MFDARLRRLAVQQKGKRGRLGTDSDEIASEDGLLDSRTAAVRSRKPEHQVNAPRLWKLNGDAWVRRRRFQQVPLLQQFHLPAHLVHERSALRLCGLKERLLGRLPILGTQEWD